MTSRIAGAWAVLALASAVAAAQSSYTITDIGVLKGDNESSGFWLNNNGEVVGCSDIETAEGYPCTGLVPGQHAFSWTKSGGIKDLGTLSGATVSGAIGINDAGKIVGYSNVKGQLATNFVAVQWSSTGAITSLGTLWKGSSSCAFEINANGEVAGDSFASNNIVYATDWTSNKIKSIGRLSNSIFTAGLAINGSGHIVGESVFGYGPPFTSHGFLWNGSSMKDLGTLPGGITSMANGINDSGVMVGQSDGGATGGLWHAVLWNSSDKIQDLGTLVGGTYSVAFAVNDSSVVVGYGNIWDNAAHAMIWTSTGGMQDLNDLISSSSGWVLLSANAINRSGQITGYGTKNGKNHAYLLTPQ